MVDVVSAKTGEVLGYWLGDPPIRFVEGFRHPDGTLRAKPPEAGTGDRRQGPARPVKVPIERQAGHGGSVKILIEEQDVAFIEGHPAFRPAKKPSAI